MLLDSERIDYEYIDFTIIYVFTKCFWSSPSGKYKFKIIRLAN